MSPVTVNLSRRGFLKAGSGLVLGLHLSGFGPVPELDEFISTGTAEATGKATSLNAFPPFADSTYTFTSASSRANDVSHTT